MSRLTGPLIRYQIEQGAIRVDPYDPARVQAASIDLTLGAEVRVYSALLGRSPLDVKAENPTRRATFSKIRLRPGILYLMHTVERVHTLQYEVDVTGKSSLGRLGIIVHHTAGHIDPGFDGQYTLEVAVVHPVVVYAGMPFCQARFHTLQGEVEDYRLKGNYTGEAALGAQPSRSWKHK